MDLTLCLTHDCNLACSYCYAGDKNHKIMSVAMARDTIDYALTETQRQITTYGAKAEFQLGFFGGEPLLEWETLQKATDHAIAKCKEAGIKLTLTLTTNMTLLSEDKVKWMNDRGFFIGLSLDGNQAMHDVHRRFRDGRSSHDQCIKALQWYRGLGANAEIIIVVDPENVAHVADSVQWLIEQDIRDISLNPNFYTEWSDDTLAIWRSEYEKVGEIYLEHYRNDYQIRINFIDGKIRSHLAGGHPKCRRCGFGNTEIAVSAAGNIYPCERLVGNDDNVEMQMGNIIDGLDRNKQQTILASHRKSDDACLDCALRERCMRWCGCINYATTGHPGEVDGIVCFHEQLAISVADHVGEVLYEECNPLFLAKFYD